MYRDLAGSRCSAMTGAISLSQHLATWYGSTVVAVVAVVAAWGRRGPSLLGDLIVVVAGMGRSGSKHVVHLFQSPLHAARQQRRSASTARSRH